LFAIREKIAPETSVAKYKTDRTTKTPTKGKTKFLSTHIHLFFDITTFVRPVSTTEISICRQQPNVIRNDIIKRNFKDRQNINCSLI
jgi:hypothetical protein